MKSSEVSQKLTALLKQGRNVLITGQAGTGKTTLIHHLAQESKGDIILTATTGVAALTLGGCTIHSFTGINIQTSPEYVETLSRSRRWSIIASAIRSVKVIVIDECSMLRPDVFELIDAVLRKVTRSKKVFGGKQLILCGDFLQLPPVIKAEDDLPSPWIFQSTLWEKANFAVLHLTENFRQDDTTLIKALSEIRQGNCPSWVDELFSNQDKIIADLGVDPVRFVPKNAQAERINQERLDDLPGEIHSFVAKIKGETDWLKDQIKRDCLAPESLHLTKGAQVMFLNNDKDKRWVNGSMGIVMDFHEVGAPIVKIAKTGEVCALAKHRWERKDCYDTVLASFEQIPLKLAYAVTIHKSQGLTLDAAEMDCRGIFTDGQAYVGLSRVRTLAGLRLLNWDRRYVAADPDALKFYESLGRLSAREGDC